MIDGLGPTLALAGSAALLSLASSLHCAGMCGAFALVARTAPEWHLGKALTYAGLGAAAGSLGGVLLGFGPALAWAGAALCAVAVVVAAARIAGLGPLRFGAPGRAPSLLSGVLQEVVRSSGAPLRLRRLGFGAACGLLPCGVLYAGLGLAALAGGALAGATVMAGFALGTAPALVVVGLGGRRLGAWGRDATLRRAAGAFVLVVGLWVVAERAPAIGADAAEAACAVPEADH